MAYHPPAAGGRTAWGVGESKAGDDPESIKRAMRLKEDHNKREEERLARINAMKSDPSSLLDSRHSRRGTYELSRTSGDDFRKNHLEVLERMKQAKEEKKLERKRRREEGLEQRKKQKREKKEKEESSSSDVSSDSSSASSKASKKSKKSEPEEEVVIELTPEEMLKAAQARAREREVKKKAEEAAQAWAAEQKKKEAEVERQRQEEVRRKNEQLEVKKKLEALQKKKEEEATKQVDEAPDEEAEKKKAEEAEKRKALFKVGSGQKTAKGSTARGDLVIGGYRIGQTVFASKNITVKGQVVIKQNCQGSVTGPSENNPMQRIGVRFSKREDRGIGLMNVVPAEIKKSLR